MIQAYTILHKIDRIDPSNFFYQAKYKGTRNHNMKLFKPLFKSELRNHAFSQRIIEDWNSPTDNIVNSESMRQIPSYFWTSTNKMQISRFPSLQVALGTQCVSVLGWE